MRKLFFKLLLLFSLCFSTSFLAQVMVAKKGSFGVDDKNKIIIWHVPNLDSIIKKFSVIEFNKIFKLSDGVTNELSYEKKILVRNKDIYSLFISKYPLIHLTFNDSVVNSKYKIPGYFTYFEDNKYVKTSMGLRHRGNLSLSFAKKSFDLEFWEDSTNRQSKDLKFKELRSDDDWILDAMFNEPLRLRSYIATNLWSKIHKPYYLEKEPNAKSGFDVKYVEVFKNNEYYGIYQFSESLDRKQLKLKKNKKNIIYGELYKADSYKGGPSFEKSSEKYINLLTKWNGWEISYPIIKDEANWENLSEFSDLVVNSSDETFLKNIESKINFSNVIDYYLFVNLLGATDNLGKNYYLGKYDENEPYFFIPWDLDGVWGVIQDGKPQWFTSEIILDNGLLKRLLVINPNDYKEKVKKRWVELRLNEFSNEKLFLEIDNIYNRFTDEKIYEREYLVWKNKLNKTSNEEHYDHLRNWLIKRLIYLDSHFKNL